MGLWQLHAVGYELGMYFAGYSKAEVVDIPTHVTGKPCQAANMTKIAHT